MNNEKGFALTGTLVSIMILTSMFITVCYIGVISTSKNLADSRLIAEEMVEGFNGKERLYTLLNENVSFEGDIAYEDLDREFKVTTVNEEFSEMSATSNLNTFSEFELNNKSDIKINFTAPNSCIYSAQLLKDGVDLLEGQVSNKNGNTAFIINGEKLYNATTHNANYGKFQLKFTNTSNCSVSGVASYKKLIEREILIEGESLQKKAIIKNESGEFKVSFLKGGI